MAGSRQQGSNEIFVRADIDRTFNACLRAAQAIGKIKQSSSALGNISINIPMKMFPPRNPVNLKISVVPRDGGCSVICNGDSFDGSIGFGSVPKSIDAFYEALSRYIG